MNRETKWRIVWVVMFIIFGVMMVIDLVKKPKVIRSNSTIPIPDPNRAAHVYDFYKDRWVYKDELSTGAKGVNGTGEPQRSNDDIQDYLEEHLDGYKEDTYFGEEWDANDKEN